ncbi:MULTISPECIES: PP2C family protein-serine/threonine phosphatase [Prauserella salsuginis group]|uniref:Serine phosphatase RsbU (Regulator of sigma subunit) n=2 Tax=Prauserella salsuginis group TaxID=2893672 RepID=A0A839XT02_9PSEU|nr:MULTISPECIES: SpoIIE family protein phosphatase [Prauserella salsuginis group]MBB3663733.1 serine phosphatase RsbU (regulator of sigma subunit) [Prauserella sediminis]MCR3722487.1 Serine phosphatase RsbU, regulator of sigma subunit [Prauserella flava]MCR3736929.1 Serine phosphatase RsbU, regulator of sigma subunit [Prauserella salsuginis]
MSVERELSGPLSAELARAVRAGRLPADAWAVLAEVLESLDPAVPVGHVVESLTDIVPGELGEAELPSQEVRAPARGSRDRDLRWRLADKPMVGSPSRDDIDRTAFLDEVSRASATSLNSAEMLSQISALVQSHQLADITRVWRSTDDGLRCVTPSSGDARPDLTAQQALITRRSVRTGSSRLSVPLLAGRHALGVLDLERRHRGFTSDDISLAHAVAGRTALGLRNAYEYEREHELAERLQYAMLPALAELDEFDIAARYRSSTRGVHIGGDWYDAFSRSDGTVVLTVGDVTGHGLDAAVVMGQLQNALRAYALEGHGPASSLRLVHELLREGRGSLYATAVVVEVQRRNGMIRWASAGHPPPLVQDASGDVVYLDADHGPMLGIDLTPSIPEHRRSLTSDSSVALYTDGLIERRRSDIDAGMARLAAAFERCGDGKVDERTDNVLHEMLGGTDHDDDVCLLLCRWLGPS